MTQSFSPVSRALIITAALFIILAGMKMAAPLIVPFLLSTFIAIISFPLLSKLQQAGMSRGIALTLVMLLVILVGVGLTVLIGSSITDFSRMLPVYQQKITLEWSHNLQWLSDHGISLTDNIKALINPAEAVGLVSTIIKGFGNVLTNSFLILLTVIFILMETAGLTQKALMLNGGNDRQVLAGGDKEFTKVFVENLRNYMSMKTIISAVTGVFIGLMLWLIGVDYPVLWGVLAFMLNFVPNIGSIIAAVPAVLLTMVQLNMSSALLVAVVYIIVNIVIGSVVEPRYMGKGLGLSTLVVFISLVFWGWILGPVGMLLSVPLTMTVKLALDSKPETQWLGHLLGPVD
ncbi:Uncharacterized UPF0118 membrane protein [hydrothermal vent metagenome]|uniref:Uncharacterized UPF0118 membrane protein n=1 Tax=hydrothermal vent metagenome TaxID=652676 RepID=A0A3B0X423_9ZZZZ